MGLLTQKWLNDLIKTNKRTKICLELKILSNASHGAEQMLNLREEVNREARI